MPNPISRTLLPSQRANSANPGMWDSTKYLRASTSSKYSREPTGCAEWRILHGREFQYSLTFEIGVSVKATEVFMASMQFQSPWRKLDYNRRKQRYSSLGFTQVWTPS